MRTHHRLTTATSVFALIVVAGCKDFLEVRPQTEVPAEDAIVDARSARAAARGLYDQLQSGSYYGGAFTFFMDLSGPDVIHTGTFTTYADADKNRLTTDNGTVSAIWGAAYATIGRANSIIKTLPGVSTLPAAERDVILGEAYFIRALAYHDLVKIFGQRGGLGVPLRLQPPTSIDETFAVTRAPTAQVYTQILADLTTAEPLLAGQTDRHRATLAAVRALRSRVLLFQENWSGTVAAARQVLTMPGYSLAAKFSDLFTSGVANTPENIFQLSFTVADASSLGFFYISKPLGGRREIAPTGALFAAFGGATDLRRDVTLKSRTATTYYGAKFPSVAGDDDFHVIRLAEVVLNKAEGHARLAQLDSARVEVNKIRTRAGLVPVAIFADTGAAMTEIRTQRRLELALEGFRWPDLVRWGLVASLGPQALYPIPQREIDVTQKGSLVQNPGY